MWRGPGRRRWDVMRSWIRTRNQIKIGLQLWRLLLLLLNYAQSATYASSPVEVGSIITVVGAKGSGQKRTGR